MTEQTERPAKPRSSERKPVGNENATVAQRLDAETVRALYALRNDRAATLTTDPGSILT